MMPNILQYPIALFGTLRAGCTVVNVNPLYTARELEHQLNDSGAEVIVVVENFAHTLAEIIGKTKVRHVVVTSIGELLGLKGVLVNLVLRRIKKMIPPYRLPNAIRMSDVIADGRKRGLQRVPLVRTTAKYLLTNWYGDWSASGGNSGITHQAVCGRHGNGPYGVLVKVGSNFQGNDGIAVLYGEGLMYLW